MKLSAFIFSLCLCLHLSLVGEKNIEKNYIQIKCIYHYEVLKKVQHDILK